MELNNEQLQTLRHMLGIDKPSERDPQPYRDYAAAQKDSAEFAELERLGAVRLYSQQGSYDWYTTTAEGRAAAIASHRAIRLSKPKRLYKKFLDVADVHCELTFREFLTSPDYADARSAA